MSACIRHTERLRSASLELLCWLDSFRPQSRSDRRVRRLKIPRIRTTWGGLRISTSRPNALCHQLSNGAEVSIVSPPHSDTNAPSGPQNPHIFTDEARRAASLPKVVETIRYALEIPATTAPKWIARCAGVQKVSRPIDKCQEMSQNSPPVVAVAAMAEHHTYQAVVCAFSSVCSWA